MTPLVDLFVEEARSVTGQDVADRLALGNLKRAGVAERIGPCPTCGGTDRFSINTVRNVWNCRGSGSGGGDAIGLAAHILGMDLTRRDGFLAACSAVTGQPVPDGEEESAERRRDRERALAQRRREAEARRVTEEKVEAEALAQRVGDGERIWNESAPVSGTLAETHLVRHRLLTLEGVRPEWCRFHPGPTYTKDGAVKRLPAAMVCLLRDVVTAQACGLRLTALDPNGGKAFRVVLGRAKQAAVQIDDDADVTLSLALAEGVETALRLRQAGESPVWATVSAGNLSAFPVLPVVETLRIYGDADRPDAHGREAGQSAARDCALRWQAAGREAVVFLPPEAGLDWDDVLREGRAA